MQNKELEYKASPLRKKYRKRIDKKKASKPLPVQILMERTFGSAVAVLALIDEISWEKLTFEMYYICNDLEFKRFIRLYDSQLELAALDQEKFIFGLHKFYNDISRELKEENKYYEFAQFIGAVMQLQFEKKEKLNENIVDAYLSLILQTLECLLLVRNFKRVVGIIHPAPLALLIGCCTSILYDFLLGSYYNHQANEGLVPHCLLCDSSVHTLFLFALISAQWSSFLVVCISPYSTPLFVVLRWYGTA